MFYGMVFGFKLHLIINDKGETLNFIFTSGNVDDWEPLKQGKFVENIKKLCADKGYIGQTLFENLFHHRHAFHRYLSENSLSWNTQSR